MVYPTVRKGNCEWSQQSYGTPSCFPHVISPFGAYCKAYLIFPQPPQVPIMALAQPVSTILPPEIWLHVFRWATLSISTPSLFATTYHPFQARINQGLDEALRVKAAITRVCKLWNQLGLDFLYEDLLLLRSNAKILRQTLQDEEHGDTGINRKVHRILLPYSSSIPRGYHSSSDSIEFLRECTELKVLVRPPPAFTSPLEEFTRFDFPADPCPPLTSLQRLDWWHHNDASRTGGVNCLPEVLLAAPNLQYLTLAGDVWLGLLQTPPVELPNLTTLRLQAVNILFVQLICRWSLPSLQTLVVESFAHSPATLQGIWTKFGKQIKRVELGRNLKFLVTNFLSTLLTHCEELQELNYYVHFTAPIDPQSPVIWHRVLETVRLHAHFHTAVPYDVLWEQLVRHLQLYSRPSFSRLKRVLLYGNWEAVMSSPEYPSLVKKLLDRGCVVETVSSE